MTTSMMKTLMLIFAAISFLDFIYISLFIRYFGYLFKKVQKSQLDVNRFGLVGAYLLLTYTVYYFGFVRELSSKDMFVLGSCIYGIYELTNYTTFDNWEMKMVIIDTIWGGMLFYITHIATTHIL